MSFDVLADTLTGAFVAAIVLWLLFALGAVVAERFGAGPATAGGQRLVAFTPAGLAMLGVLGTFVGILIGLWKFDESNIMGSVPGLLGALKLAFASSVAGLGAALVFRFLAPLLVPSAAPEPEARDVHGTLEAIRDAVSRADERLEGVREGQAEMVREFRDFHGGVTEEGTKAIVAALEKVVGDFNRNLTEQFGENFRRLNEAVEHLVEWQDRYRVHVETMEARATKAIEAIEAVRGAVADIARSCEAVPQAFARLEPVLASFAARTDDLEGHLQALAALRERVGEALPAIEAGLQGIIERAAEGAQAATDSARAALEEAEKAGEQARMAQAETAKHINDRISELDAGMERELQQALQSMGEKLAGITEKLASDFQRVLESLQKSDQMLQAAVRDAPANGGDARRPS